MGLKGPRHAQITEFVFHALKDLSKREIQVYVCLLWHRNLDTGLCKPSRKTMCEYTGIDKGNISRTLAALVKRGWVLIEGNQFILPLEPLPKRQRKTLPEKQPEVAKIATEVAEMATAHLIDEQRTNIVFNNRSIDDVIFELADEYPEVDNRVIAIGVLYTLLQKDPEAKISSINYFKPEIGRTVKANLKEETIQALLYARQENYNRLITTV